VKAVFDMIAPAVGLSVGLAVGQTSIAAEAAELVEVSKKMVHSFGTLEHCQKANVASRVDILVATPGRLMDHFRSTPGFTIGDLQYLVGGITHYQTCLDIMDLESFTLVQKV
jgi:ATP-dependent RNA helicase DDX51/DBP6